MLEPTSPINRFGSFSKGEDSHSLSNEELQNIITQLETDITEGTWTQKNYASTDKEMMPSMVNQANKKYPNMNLNFIVCPNELCLAIRDTIEQGIESSRFIINIGENAAHFAVVDYKHLNGKTSLILFEPASFNFGPPALQGLRTKLAIERYDLPDCHFSMAELDIQRSSSECGIFSLALAKKLHTEESNILKIHEDNINGILGGRDSPVPYEKLDTYLPATFYKHTQSQNRLNDYLTTNPQQTNTIVNKKNENLLDRFSNNQSTADGKELSVSPHNKRITEYKSLINP